MPEETSRLEFDELRAEDLIAPEASSPVFPLLKKQRAALLRRASRTCTPAQRHLLVLRYREERSYADIALLFHISEPSAFEMHRRAIAQLLATLARMGIARLDQI